MSRAKAKGLTLELLPCDTVAMHSDRRRLLQCFLNLLGNAVKYTERGGIKVQLSADDTQVEIAVTDTGAGIAEQDLPKLFQQFSRLDSPLTRRTLGTGLGLYLTRKLAREVLGGDVSVVSSPGEGSRFTLRSAREISP